MATMKLVRNGISRLDYAGTYSYVGNGWMAVKLNSAGIWSVSPESGSARGVGIIVPAGQSAEDKVIDYMANNEVPCEDVLTILRTGSRGSAPIPLRRTI